MKILAQILNPVAGVTPLWLRKIWSDLRHRRLALQRALTLKFLNDIGYKILFEPYGTIESPAKTFVPHGLGGPSIFSEKRFFSPSQLRFRETALGLQQVRPRLLVKQETPISFLQSAMLLDGRERISKFPKIRWYKETHRLCQCPQFRHRPKLLVPFSEGFYHEMLEVLTTLVSHRFDWCIRLCLDAKTSNGMLLSFLRSELNLIETSPTNRGFLFGHTYKWPAVYPTRKQIALARDFFCDGFEERNPGTALFVKRKPGPNGRNVLNEEEVEGELRRRNYEVRSVYLENFEVLEQIRFFSSADLIISPTGAGLANLFAVAPNCCLIELMADTDVRWHFFRIAEILSIRSLHILCQTTERRGLIVDINNLRLALDAVESSLGRNRKTS